MKPGEDLAHQYLLSLGLGSVVYEPEKNLPPDFLINGTIAVEVRRLNQNEVTHTGEVRGLEETSIPFNMRFRRLLASVGPPQTGSTWFVTYRIQRPMSPWDELLPAVRKCLTDFLGNPPPVSVNVSVDDCLEIRFYPASKVHPTVFVWGAGTDGDSGGFMVNEMLKNLRLCVEQKTLIVAPHRHKYPEWWLVFIDHIGWALDEDDRQKLREYWNAEHDWDKIILVNPTNPLSAFELTSKVSS